MESMRALFLEHTFQSTGKGRPDGHRQGCLYSPQPQMYNKREEGQGLQDRVLPSTVSEVNIRDSVEYSRHFHLTYTVHH